MTDNETLNALMQQARFGGLQDQQYFVRFAAALLAQNALALGDEEVANRALRLSMAIDSGLHRASSIGEEYAN